MAKILCGLIAAVLCVALVDSLTCNNCAITLFGKCFGSSNVACTANQTNCYTGTFSFSSFSYSSMGCTSASPCNATSTSNLLFLSYTVSQTCCGSNNCNTASSAATSAQLSVSAAVSTALVAAVWNSWMH